MAGVVGRVRRLVAAPYGAVRKLAMAEAAGGFDEKAFFEYHLYTLGRPATVAQNQTKQIELLKAGDVPVKKVFLYDGAPQYRFYGGLNNDANYGSENSNNKGNVAGEVRKSKENKLG